MQGVEVACGFGLEAEQYVVI